MRTGSVSCVAERGNARAGERDRPAGPQQARELGRRLRGEVAAPAVQLRQGIGRHADDGRRERRPARARRVGDLPQDGRGADARRERPVAARASRVARGDERRPLVERVVERYRVGGALGARAVERGAVGERERREPDRDGEEARNAGGARGRAMQGQQGQAQRHGRLARDAQARADRGLQQAPEQDGEREAREQRGGGERERRARRSACRCRASRLPAAARARPPRPPRPCRRAARLPGARRPCRRRASATTASAPIEPAATSATLAGVARPCESAGPTGTSRAVRDDRDGRDADREAGGDAGQHGRERLGEQERGLLRERRAALAQAAQLGAHVAAQRAGRQPGEREQQHRGGAADEQDAPRRRTALRARLRERIVRRRDAELAVGGRQARLGPALAREQAVDVPDVRPPGSKAEVQP